MGRESVQDWSRRERPPDFQTHFRIERAVEVSPNASVQNMAQTTGIALSTVFYILARVLHLEFRNWRWAPHKLSYDQKRTREHVAVSLQAELERAQRKNWREFYTDDESWILWQNFPKGC
jgi:hypothetical protein